MSFSHLHVHSHYSLLNALPKIPDLIEAARKDGMSALALTDNGNLYGAIEFYKDCQKAGIKPIIGVDAYVAQRGRADKQAGVDNNRYRLVLLAKNEVGYKNLIKIVTISHFEGFYYKPRIDKELIERFHEGLIAISSSFAGEIARTLLGSESAKAEEAALWYKQVFGDDLYIEISIHPEITGHNERMQALSRFARENNIKTVAAHDVYYISPEDKPARDTLLSVQTNPERDRGGWNDGEEDFSFINQAKANEYFKEFPEALENVQEVVDKCNLTLSLGSWVFPDFKIPAGTTHDEELKRVVYEGLSKRGLEKTKEVEERIEYELKIIKNKGYSPYFLVMADLIRYARENKILTNTRGSVAGSIVSYLTFITTVDPIDYKLPFERFLNPERPSAPDIDLDIADNRRDEMIDYARKKYGEDKVAQIGTFGTMLARGVVRDVARALGYPYALGDRIAKLIPFGSQGFPMSIDRAFELVSELKEMYSADSDVRKIIDLGKKIEGCARHISVHAAGVVISPEPLTNYVPLQFDPKGEGKIITQYDMYAIEDAGLLKFDFLGIKNLAIIADTLHRVEAIENKIIDIDNIPLDDKSTFKLLARGETEGLFQLNGDGMTKFLVDLKPTSIHDINAMVALYRPGPMEVIPEYIKRKNNPKLISYIDPRMEKFLKESYGLIVYQDDLLFSAIELAGYSWLEADKFRKAVGKKIPAEMAAQKEKFIEGVVKNGQTKKFAEDLWRLFEPFQAYGFNKAHAASYGRVAYQTAYLKANFPAIYMSAVMTAESGNIEKIGEMVVECKRMGIPVLPPSVNESYQGFSVVRKQGEPDTIRFGLTTVKNFGEGIANSIVKERKTNGKFKSLADFIDRIKDRNLNKKSLEALIKCGALDEFGERGVMMANIDLLLEYHKERMKDASNQDSLFTSALGTQVPSLSLPPAPEATMEEKLLWEKELLGLFISGHPLDKHKEKLEKLDLSIAKIKSGSSKKSDVMVVGIVDAVREVITKNNEPMLFITVSDYTGSIESVVFPSTYQKLKDILKLDACVAIVGKLSKRNDEISLIAEKAKLC
ncbi:MAG: DNA polymerase III subunit alpha [Candidatus Zambryskibacteria bacterium RIFCSPLOWO2_01_FULL_43_17]|uniref:DNA polymerase III subunit alpha n=1 Tax=Candidatus Zambryskibacteria bacterium RIFCSPLOWO2_01_FULL_43_17 TaxID=1802760 RepID=A0A1G2U5N3_9BACT|nr:MAG: DNA polymerase III subunit alpha [Candidatus Zambryskibacteria bacterium RIFCSPLOWO2_01_FULL_43_17]